MLRSSRLMLYTGMEQTGLKRDPRYYRRVWFGTTLFVAAIFGAPFAFFFLIFDGPPDLKYMIFIKATPSMVIGVILAILAGHRAVWFLHRSTERIARAHELAQVRERERDLAQQELIKKLQEERQLAQMKVQFEAQLAEYEKYAALAQLALGAAHEINNPLLGILSHLELSLRDAKTEEDRIEIEQCIEGTKRISKTIRGLLNYTRPDPLLLTRINLQRLVDDAFSFLVHQPLFRGISLEKQLARDLPEVTADANQLSQILMNLLINAAQASPDGGVITVTAQKVKFADSIEIVVSDTGSGIGADVLPHIFEPFFTTKRGKGTGLGLSISQAYVRSHGGDIKVDSLPNRGTNVRITLPLRQEGRIVAEPEEVIV
ncbi:MAG TPA: ATP-binding protein [Terriglobales bacterium]|nr:ATP-binding protein [Terriglobales bacterium]